MADTRIDYQLRAEKQFKKEERATEGAKAMSEYKAEVEAERRALVQTRPFLYGKHASAWRFVPRRCRLPK